MVTSFIDFFINTESFASEFLKEQFVLYNNTYPYRNIFDAFSPETYLDTGTLAKMEKILKQ